jgi:hypothetical protein
MYMIKIIAMAVTCMFLISFPSLGAQKTDESSKITVTYQFPEPIFQKIQIEDTQYDQIIIPGVSTTGDSGEPQLPICGAYLLLPPYTHSYHISVDTADKTLIATGCTIVPGATPVPLSLAETAQLPVPDQTIYYSNNLYPGEIFSEVGTYYQRGYEVLVLLLHPVQYMPTTGDIWFYPSITITVDVTGSATINPQFRNLASDKELIQQRVDNPQVADLYNQQTSSVSEQYDMLIITTQDLKPGFDVLASAHTDKGITTIVKTLDDIGSANPDDIRAYIRDAYNEWGISYVLIGGDHDVVPAKILWVYGLDEGTTPYETFLPSDLYYACLDGTYNYDGDEKWGEPTDGDDGGDVDLLAEVFVGRACVGNLTETGFFVNKTIAQLNLNSTEDYLQECLLAGEYLGPYGVASWGGNYLDELIDECNLDGYVTMGIPSDEYTLTKLYDREYPGNDWPAQDLIDQINNGVYMIHHDGHSNYGYNMKMTNEDVLNYIHNDEKFCFIYSVGCMAGGFDDPMGYDCIAEYLTSKTPYGAFASIMNARYGWFWSFSTDGDGTRFTREFCDAVYGEDITVISQANQDSKEDNLYLIGRSCMRWTYYQLNLFGDPALSFFTPENFNTAPETPQITGPSQGKAGEDLRYTIVSSDLDMNQIYYYVDWGDGNATGWFGPTPSGNEVTKNHTYVVQGTYEIKAKAKDTQGAESPWAILPIEIPRNKITFRNLMLEFVKNYFPRLYLFLFTIENR